MSQLKEDYLYNLRLAQWWFKRLGKYKRDIDNEQAEQYHQGHLAIAEDIKTRQYEESEVSRKQKNHIPNFGERLENYVDARGLDVSQYSPYHFRIMDGGYTTLDTWTTGKYWVVMTDYATKYDGAVPEREGEKGNLPVEKGQLWPFLDKLFFGEDMSAFTDFNEE